jgi:hypothetical protein
MVYEQMVLKSNMVHGVRCMQRVEGPNVPAEHNHAKPGTLPWLATDAPDRWHTGTVLSSMWWARGASIVPEAAPEQPSIANSWRLT